MENQNKPIQDCGCGDGCCTPPKNNSPWQKWLFILIIVAVAAIITIKLVTKDDAEPAKCCPDTECADKTSCCPDSN